MKKVIPLIFNILLFTGIAIAQCDGGDPTMNNPTNYDSSLSIEENYNNARRWEESNLNLTSGCLGNMVAPSGGWSSLTDSEIALYIHNSEREARGKLPFYGVEANLEDVAQAHSDWQIANDVFSHGGDPNLGSNSNFSKCSDCNTDITGSSPFDRMNQSAPLAGQWQKEAENIASNVTSGSFIPDFVAQGIYRFIYQDASSGWGHRHNVLISFDNDWGDNESEGFIGVGVKGGNNWTSCRIYCSIKNFAKILTVDYYDPQSNATGYSFTALPLEILSFEAYRLEDNIMLKWSVAKMETDYFVVQKSKDGNGFYDTAYIDAEINGDNTGNYSFLDKNPSGGTNFYRLVAFDYNGNKTYSKVVAVHFDQKETVKVSPNPFKTHFTVDTYLNHRDNEMSIFDIQGNLLFHKYLNAGNNKIKVDFQKQNNGIYFVKITNSAMTKTFKIIKY